MHVDKLLILARKHLGSGAEESARLCLADAIALYDKSDYHSAWERALKSLAYSVGLAHADYRKARLSGNPH